VKPGVATPRAYSLPGRPESEGYPMIQRPAFAFERFTMIPNEWARDSRLSRRARGLLLELMSHAAGWEVTLDSLVEDGPEGRDALRSAVNELEAHGYLSRVRQRTVDGRLGGMDYVMSDPFAEPEPGSPTSGFPPEATEPPIRTLVTQKTTTSEDEQQPRERASDKQVGYLADLHRAGGGTVTPAFEEWARGLSKAEAHREIREAREHQGMPVL
jgi:hypothetical protein